MAHRVLLLPHGHVGLIVGYLQHAAVPMAAVVVLLHLHGEVQRALAALIHEVLRQLQMPLVLRHRVQPHQRHLDHGMARVALALALLRAEHAVDVLHQPQHRVQQFALAGGLIVRHGRLDHVAGAVELVVIHQVCPALVQPADDVIGVHVAVGLLRRDDVVDGRVHHGLQLRVAPVGQRVGRALQPFGRVAVLKHAAAVLALQLSGGDAEVVHAMAGSGVRDAVVQRLPLVGNALAADGLSNGTPERIVNLRHN